MQKHSYLIAGLLVSLQCAVASPSFASDTLAEGAKLCTRSMPALEAQYKMPGHMLAAISATETGRYHKGMKLSVPWPWTINAEGKGYYYESKAEAIAAARTLQRQGVKSMDVGCMQVNLLHHPDAFTSLEQAFDPDTNVAYAAKFLTSLYRESGSWKQAAADYHSKTPSFGSRYAGKVMDKWATIVDKVNKVRNGAASLPSAAIAAAERISPVSAPKKPIRLAQASIDAPRTSFDTPSANSNSKSIKIIRVRDADEAAERRSSPMVISPVEVAEQAAGVLPAKLIRIAPKNYASSQVAGPRFIFSE